MPLVLSRVRGDAAGHSLGRASALGASGSGSTLNPGHIAAIATTVDGRLGTGEAASAWTHAQALVTGMGYQEGPASILGPFVCNLLAFWTARGGVVTYTADGTSGGSALVHSPLETWWRMGRRNEVLITNASGSAKAPSYEFTDPLTTASATASLIYGQTVYHTITPYVVFRSSAPQIPSNIKVEIKAGATEGTSSWTTLFDAAPTVWKGIWRGPVWRFGSGAHAVFGLRYTFTLPDSANAYEFLEVGLASNLGVPGALLYASPWRANNWNFTQAFLAATPFTVSATALIANLNADLLDGLHASDFVAVTGNQTIGGTKTFSSDILVNSSGTQTVYHTGNLPQNRLVPPGGTTGQALTKSSSSDYAVAWSSVAAETANRWATARTITLGTDLTGNTSIDGSANVTLNATIANGAVTLAKMANIATARLLGRVSAGSGVVEELTAAQVKTLLAIGIADVSGLQTALDGKAAVSHTHSAADITSGTLASARLSGSYTGITAVGSLSSLTVGGTTSLTGAVSASNLGTDLSSGAGYKLLMRADSGYGIRAITLSGVKGYLDFQIADIPGLQTALDAKAPTSRSIATQHSLQGGGNLTADRTLSLVGDSASPGNSKYYGTNSGGTRGYHDLPTGQNVIAAARFQIHTPDDDSVSLVQSGDSGSNRFDPTTGSGQLYFTRGGVVRDPVVYEYHFSNPGSAAWYAVITPSRESYTGGTYNAPTNALAPAVLRDSSSNTECHFSLGSPFDGEWDYVPKWIDIVILKA
ncbi:MAG: hypothetical protein KF833_18660 [Verrucomicrobiae bacterium]|nr:hypothetical protein [Verrucomicrobiae bacterium]